jgi:ATP phosphoribosyltransferase regulatory subunit HisZ
MPSYDPPNTFYSHVKGLEEQEDMFQFIGKNGSHFKFLTEKLKIKYIWWNKDSNIIELWGPHNKLANARKQMEEKMDKYMQNKLLHRLESIVIDQ